jgi:parallel beta-helix repeat protein
MKNRTPLLFISLFLALMAGQASGLAPTDLTDWHVDAVNGDDTNGVGSVAEPFKSINALLSVNDAFPGFVGEDDTVYLSAGNFNIERVVIDIPRLRIEGTLDGQGTPTSILGEVKISANEVTVANCLILDAGLTLKGVEGVSISSNLFSGKTKDSLTLLGSSNNRISGNRFESATGSCVVIRFNSKNKQSSNDNVFQENYFTHHSENTTSQAVLINQSSFFKGLLGKKPLSARNRFIKCAFEETIPGQLERVVLDQSSWRMIADNEYSLKFEDCYFKKAARNTPFISFMVIGDHPDVTWYWDELANDSWVSTNKGGVLTGNKKNGFTPLVQFADGDGDGLILETKYSAGIWVLPSEQANSSPVVVSAIADIAVYENATSSTINLFDVFEDDATADENLEFAVIIDNTSLVSSQINGGQLTLNYAEDAAGMALVTITAMDDNGADPLSSEDSFHVIIVEDDGVATSEGSHWYVDSGKGDDRKGTGSESNPFSSIERVFALYGEQPDLKSADSTIHLGKGKYSMNVLEINIPDLIIEGTLDEYGRPLTLLGETRILANGVKLMNCEFRDTYLTLLNVEDVFVSNNVFSGVTGTSLYVLGSSNNTIQHNEFSSAVHDCVHIYWDPDSERSSNDNVFLRNHFTHRPSGITNRVIRVNWSSGTNHSVSARNRFVECAFKETSSGQLLRVIDDDSTWWMVADHQYSVMFEDCYFKRADRPNPFSEFVILKGHPDFTWRCDELINDEWISKNLQWGLTGDHNGWSHKPRIQFVDKNENGKALEMVYDAGLLPIDDD